MSEYSQEEISAMCRQQEGGGVSDALAEQLTEVVIRTLRRMTGPQREAAFGQIRGVFCIHCGNDDPGCQCWNDE